MSRVFYSIGDVHSVSWELTVSEYAAKTVGLSLALAGQQRTDIHLYAASPSAEDEVHRLEDENRSNVIKYT